LVKTLEEFKTLARPIGFWCECGRRLVMSPTTESVRCKCGMVWKQRKGYIYARFLDGWGCVMYPIKRE